MNKKEEIIISGLLGKLSDTELAKRFEVSVSFVNILRNELSIPKYRPISKQELVHKAIDEIEDLDFESIKLEGNFTYISLSKGQEALIDVKLEPIISRFNWYASYAANRWYATTSFSTYREHGKHQDMWLHRFIMASYLKGLDTKNYVVDHIDHNGLNNTLINLRIATKSENSMNSKGKVFKRPKSSKYKGVYRDPRNGSYDAYISKDKKRKYLGGFSTEIEAAEAYNQACIEIHGEFACINIIDYSEIT